MSSTKIIILAICLNMVANSLAYPGIAVASSGADLQKLCKDGISQCQTILSGVPGLNLIVATLLSTTLVLVVLPLLLTTVITLTTSTTISIASHLVGSLLGTLVQIIGYVVDLLTGTLSLADFNRNIDACETNCKSDLTSSAGSDNIILNLCLSVLSKIMVVVKLGIAVPSL